MPLPFSSICELLDQCYTLSLTRKSCASIVIDWFDRHRNYVDAHDTSLSALLSTLLPDKRTDRVYCIQAPSLERIIGRACLLGASRIAELARYRQPGSGVDLADCVHRILTVTPNPGYSQRDLVTVEEIDELLHSLASKVSWSSPSIRASQASMTPANRTDVELMYRRLSAVEARWFTRLILKRYQPLVLDPHLIYRLCDPLLPCVLKVQDDFATAITTTQTLRRRLIPNSGRQTPREQIMGTAKPQLGIKIGRQPWIKGRSIKHCLDMGHGRMSVEEKIDGEYCQIHIDPNKGDRCIQIFSKSGKDSTEDRVALHGTIIESLKIGQPDARVTKGCILEGELVVYDDYQNKILPFHKIRKHVSRRGVFLNTDQDSLPGPQEHLMIIYYDIMLLDDQSLINLRHSERFKILSNLICCSKGWAELVPRQVVDFGQPLGVSALRKTFALTILARKEGLVLKPDEPYFDFKDQRRKFSSCCIKLKKEYIGNLGDVGDFAVVGAKYDSAKTISYRIPGLKWTHFYVGCLDNRESVRSWKAKPEFTIVNVVELNETLLREVVTYSNPEPVAPRDNEAIILKQAPGVEQGLPPTAIFTKPLVFDIKCFSFDRMGSTGFWSLRFPSVTKVHFDRDFTDTISFEQLQKLAKDATTAAALEDSQENLQWIAKLEAADPRGIAVDAASQLTVTTMPTPSPRKSTQNTTSTWSPTSPLTTRSPAGNIDSPCRDRVGRSSPLILSTAVATLPTPAAPLDSPTGQRAKQKRDPLIIQPAPPHKRPKLYTESPSKDKHPLDSATSSQPRQPLNGVNDNSRSQPVMITCASLSTSGSDSDENNAPGSAPCVDLATSVPSGNDLETDAELRRDIPVNNIVSTGTKGCIYANEECAFVKTDMLISPGLLNNPIAKTLLKLHGIENPVENLDAWLEQKKSGKLRETGISSTKIFLLCQSDEKEATKSLFDKIQKVREWIPHRLQNWIHVYDWRVLQHVTVQEDDTVQPKDYDGFHTPWQRWRIGPGLI
uniref:ATP-dependent DNA ligase family profile domain-containing protein n=1 Tax=Gibberella zeae (strain ATCC MYA-4620 / CBS 123657 / FGSC 9075 / NRRL 31084 / PH-1) TaxID=229533 RepID=A0A098DN54_GIBZE